jgi:uroporphyrin-3 C-methyltransferase
VAHIWFVHQQWQQSRAEYRQTKTELADLAKAMDSLQRETVITVREQAGYSKDLQSRVATLSKKLSLQARQVAELRSTGRSDWLLAEALHLARLANQRLQTERSSKNPLALLQTVDTVLREMDDPDFLPLRTAVAKDITALRLVEDVDVEGIFLELASLTKIAGQLPLTSSPAEQQPMHQMPEQTPEQPEPERQGFKHLIDNFLQDISQLIRVQHLDQPIAPLLKPSSKAIVRQNLAILLEQAQTAVLRQQQKIYSHNLSRAQAILAEYFQGSADAQMLADRLAILAQTPMARKLPDISGSLIAIETLLALREADVTVAPEETR